MIDDEAIVSRLRREFPDTAAVYRFGSTVAGGAQADSDIDLAILPDRPVDPLRRFSVQEQLALDLHRNVDLVDLAAASTVLRMQIVSGGHVLATIERCIARVREEYSGDDRNLLEDQRRQDSIILNLQRACEAAIDLAMHVVRTRRLGIPRESRDAFVFLRDAGVIEPGLAGHMLGMVGFRNIAVHDYRQLDLVIVRAIVTERLDDLLDLTRALLRE